MTNNYTGQELSPDEAAMYMSALTVYGFLLLFAYIIRSIALGRIFAKAGQPAWKAWVPVYNQWTMLQLGGQPGWLSVVLLIPLVNIFVIVFLYVAMHSIGLKLQKSGWFILWAIFMPIVWYVWLATDESTWSEKRGAPRRDTPPEKTDQLESD